MTNFSSSFTTLTYTHRTHTWNVNTFGIEIYLQNVNADKPMQL